MEGTSKSIVHQNPIKITNFENLPEHLIHYIMNFLPYKDATKFSVLSKAFHSSWLSFPVLDFDCYFFQRHKYPDHSFFSFILKTLKLRSPHLNNSFQKFRLFYLHNSLKVPSVPFSRQRVLNKLLSFAIENKSKEIVFEIPISCFMNVIYEPLVDLFSSEFLTVLKFSGLIIPILDPIIHCPNLKELIFRFCKGVGTITVSSFCVNKIEIVACRELKGVQVPKTKNLSRFLLSSLENPIQLDLPACESIKSMFLYDVKVLKNNLMEPITDNLFISNCDLPMNFRIQNAQVKELNMWDIYNLQNLLLFTPNLERFCLCYEYGLETSQTRRITMNISACVTLILLELKGLAITDEWMKSVISNLGCLKELIICHCSGLRKMELKNDKLEILSLKKCSDLEEAIIESPNLLKFNYEGSPRVYPLTILSTKCSANIELPQNHIDPILWFNNINQFLSCFDHIQHITITCRKAKDLIFPIEYVSKNNPFPLRDLKYMKVQTMDQPNGHNVMKIIESLLWLVPKPLQLTLSVAYTKIIISTLKLEYGKEVKRTKVEERCCFGLPTKCWRHYELKVDIQSFNESDIWDLNKFFSPYMH